MRTHHISVLRDEAIAALNVTAGKQYIDATVGAGGHASEIIKRGGVLLGIDQDTTALELARERLDNEHATGTFTLVHGNFREIVRLAREHGFNEVSGILFDLGVSSMQLDTPERGMSFRFTDAPLDGRMDPSGGDTAAQLVNRSTENELYDIFSNYGEEQLARAIAHAFVGARSIKPITTVGDVVKIIETIVPGEEQRHGVLARVFQGMRIATNDELGSLREGLTGAKELLVPGGKLVVISFHSLEDRIVKLFMRKAGWEVETVHPIRPTDEEAENNRRSRSAKLRIATKQNHETPATNR